MFYTYVLQSSKDKKLYIGSTSNLKVRFETHNKGQVESTKERRPLTLIYYEACVSKKDATHRELYFKTTYGLRYIKSRLKSYFTG
jgi:putative endonuclease